jgi:YYY domain-containing protein
VKITSTRPGATEETEGTLTADFGRSNHPLGDAYDIPLEKPLVVTKDEAYSFTFEVVAGGPMISAGPTLAWEGDWDEVTPPKVCDFPPGVTLADDPPPGLPNAKTCGGRALWEAQLNMQKLQVFYEDDPAKRDIFQSVLDSSDYLIIGTNRRYDSQSRIPARWPMTMRYYETLFNGQLGFELIQTFQQSFQLGPIKVSDEYLPTYNGPKWLNEFEAEEAFHVYDHPVVFIFHKTPRYSSTNTQQILNSVSLNKADIVIGSFNDPQLVGVVPIYSLPASAAPTQLRFTEDLRAIQYSGGTWSNRFDSGSILNTQPVVTILAWWLIIVLFGLAAWPLLFVLLPGLADRGYGFAKITGIVITGWAAWYISSARIPMWSQGGLLVMLVVLIAVNTFIGWRNRTELGAYVREHIGRLAWIEVITLLAFTGFLLVRLTNPDLWHPSFGGEKPMDFAYFNGVLRSTIFPPIDPWNAGGYINYYYYGYVIVGTPTLLLGVVPSIAYNLILPTLFALAGTGAFSVAFNIVSAWNGRRQISSSTPLVQSEKGSETAFSDTSQEVAPFVSTQKERKRTTRIGNPWVAGVFALLLAMVFGNLDTPRVFVVEGILHSGYYKQPAILQNVLIEEYTAKNNNEPPSADKLTEIEKQANDESESLSQSFVRGLGRLFKGETLDIAPNRWYWAPTRILAEPPVNSGGAIVEMPFFTFLYGDMHAHMIAMPLQFLAMVFILNELLLAGRDTRRRYMQALALALGALTVGLLRATNTWDWVTFMVLSVLGLGFAWWLSMRRLSRWSLLVAVARIGGFVGLNFLFTLPYITWYAATYNRALPWDGPKSPLWAYLDIHGLFLFLLVSLLVWDTARWLRSVYVRSLRGTCLLLLVGFLVIVSMLIGSALLANAEYQAAIIAIPILLWIAVLFFRGGQSREMQFILALAGLAVGLTLAVEFIVLDGDLGRQNTVFKFYIQAWLLFSVVGGTAIAALVQGSNRWSGGLRSAWFGLVGLLIIAAAMYPLMATRGRALDRMGDNTPLTLDGMTYMEHSMLYEGSPDVLQTNPQLAPFSLADDYQMIRWIQNNIKGSPIIMEGQSDREYRWESRVAIYTGLPSVIGWNFHQRQQRTFDPMPRLVQQRVANVNAFYTTPDIPTAWGILQHYDVSYIIVGDLEHAYYPINGIAKFDQLVQLGKLQVVYEQDKTKVYKVVKDAGFGLEEGI